MHLSINIHTFVLSSHPPVHSSLTVSHVIDPTAFEFLKLDESVLTFAIELAMVKVADVFVI